MAHANNDNATAEQKFFELLGGFENAVLVTHDRSGPLHGRPMAIAETNDDGSIWFITRADAPKVDELQQDAHLLAVLQKERQWLTVSGRGELHRDRARIHKVWKESFRAFFDGKDDPNIALIRLNPSEAEYWDNRGTAGLKFALKYAAAYVTGKELKGTDDPKVHGKVALR
ncbi:MAG: pyridoxamine 5'-phosphate oxidase family protein [Polyangiales bacterium]